MDLDHIVEKGAHDEAMVRHISKMWNRTRDMRFFEEILANETSDAKQFHVILRNVVNECLRDVLSRPALPEDFEFDFDETL